jgi:hypothetical protein
MYDDKDYNLLSIWYAPVIIVWCGTDTTMINAQRAKILRNCKITHIVKSWFCANDLKKWNIKHSILPISWQNFNLKPYPRGENIYHYGSGKGYGESYLPLIQKETGLNIIKATNKTYSKEALQKVYESCFIGLRLTAHDGLPNTVLELGMMGRRSIYNGRIPGSIPWNNLDDICASILDEYAVRRFNDTEMVSQNIKRFIDIDDKWLNV